MHIRDYKPSDCKEIAELFYNTVHSINAIDYSTEQLDVWASGKVNLQEWNDSFIEHLKLPRLFFKQKGFIVVEDRKAVRNGIELPYSLMVKKFVIPDNSKEEE